MKLHVLATVPCGSKYFLCKTDYHAVMEMGAKVSEIGSLLGDPVRASMLTALMDGRSLPAGELAFIGNVAPQTASFHLGKLLESHLIAVERQGRHKYYRLTNEHVALALESLASIAPMRDEMGPDRGQRSSRRISDGMQFARTCYRHLVGHLAIEIHRALVSRNFVVAVSERDYELTLEGEAWLVGLPSSGQGTDRPLIRSERRGHACLDWTERHHHLGGPLGRTLFARLRGARWFLQRPGTRVLAVTPKGREGLDRQLGVRGMPLARPY
jgi:DNA-binding transcriptional ArsR family regulator